MEGTQHVSNSIAGGVESLLMRGLVSVYWERKIMLEEGNLLDADLFFTHTHMDHIQGLPFLLLYTIPKAMSVYMPVISMGSLMTFKALLELC